LHDKELHYAYFSLNVIWIGEMNAVDMCGICGRYGEKPEGKRPLGRPESRWEVLVKQSVYGPGQTSRVVGG